VSQPDIEFVKTQWKYKQAYALNADNQSRALLARISKARSSDGGTRAAGSSSEFDVFNTASWPRTDLVTLPRQTKGEVVKDMQGQRVPSQRLVGGELVFLARDVPAVGAKRYRVEPGAASSSAVGASATGTTLSTPLFRVKLDATTGSIISLRQEGLDAELAGGKLNEYIYLPGANPKDVKPCGPVKISVKETGPLVASLRVDSDAPSCRSLAREVRVVDGLDRVELIDEVDKLPVRTPEGLHFGFEFNVPGATVRINSPLAVVEPETDQLPGACENWFCVERWVDVANADYGVTWATVDAPLVEMGGLTANLLRTQPDPKAYMKTIKHSPKLYSWVMNNHWHTNYRADQEGPTTFRYAIRPHRAYDPVAAAHFGLEATEPLIAMPAAGEAPAQSPVRIESAGVVVSALKPSEDGKAWIIRLYGASGHDDTARLLWNRPVSVSFTDVAELAGQKAPDQIPVPAWSVVSLRAERP
jgi:alpha-mannosidase